MIEKLKWDSRFFKKKIGKLKEVPSRKKLKKLIQEAYKNKYEYLTCRLILGKVSDIQVLEEHGFYLADIGVMWEREVDIQHSTFPVRVATIKDAPMLKSMVRGLFRDSRFYNDPFFTEKEAERFFRAWIENAVRDKKSKAFWIKGSGFIVCRKLPCNIGDIRLIGVVTDKQGRGIGSSLVKGALNWFMESRMETVTVRTQANNSRAMNFYSGLGFRVKYIDVTMGLILAKEGVV